MKKKAAEKVETKESLLKGEALALNDAELECAAGGAGDARYSFEQRAIRQLQESGTSGGHTGTRRVRGEEENQIPVWKPIQHPADLDDAKREEMLNEMKELLDMMNREANRSGIPF